jgi:hypothetical protein
MQTVRRFLLTLAAISSALIAGSSLGSSAAVAATLVTPQQLTVAAANASGDSIYDLSLTTSSSSALIGAAAALNSDGGKHGSFDALAWSPNVFTGALDLIVADATKGQILRYAGPNYGTSSVIFTYTTKGSGPAYPAGLAVDGVGDLFVISPSSPLCATPALWVLPFNKATGEWSAPVLIDESFGGVKTLALADVLVAGTAATAEGSAAPAWHAGDVLVLVGDTFDSRVIVYSQAVISGVLAKPKVPLAGPTSTVVSSKQFSNLAAAPFGMDIWPADATHGVSLLFTTIDGRIIRFDTAKGAFADNLAAGLGLGLTKLKVGTYAGKPYAFVAQLGLGRNTGQILQFGTPPANGTNKALASVSKGVNEPLGLAVTSSGSAPASSCVAPLSCSPLGPQLTLQISGPGAARIPAGATVLQQACTVPTDPRVAVVNGVWSCLGSTINVCGTTPTPGCVPATLDVANYCPGFPSTILPATMCGHAGASGASFQVVKSTAELLDENANDIYIQTNADPTAALPGPYDLGCQQGVGQPYGQVVAFAPRSDLPTIEGTIVEDLTAPYFAEFTGFCDTGGSNTHVESMFAFGLGLNEGANGLGSGANAGLYGFITTKFNDLSTMIQDAATQITPATVTTTLEDYVTQSQNYFNNDYHNDVNDYSCALNSIASADVYLRNEASQSNPNVFSYTAPAAGNNNPNPAGEIDARLANLYLAVSGDFLYTPNRTWPTTNVPPCVTLSITATTVPVGGSATLTFGPPTPQFASTPLLYVPTQCTLSASDGKYATAATLSSTSGSVSTGTLTKSGTYTATLECAGATGDASSSFATTSITVSSAPTLTSITVGPNPASIAAGKTQQFTATGTNSLGQAATLSSVTWSTGNSAVATINSSSGLATCMQAGNSTTISATSGGIVGSATLTCGAATLASITVTPATASIPVGATQQFAASGTDTLGNSASPTVTWNTSNAAAVSITSTGLATCLTPGSPTTITATNGGITSNSAVLTCLAGSIALSANPTTTMINNNVTLTWTSANLPAGEACVLSSNSSDAPLNQTDEPTGGSLTTTEAVSQNVTYTISCTGPVTASSSVSVLYTLVTTYQYTGNQFPSFDAYEQYTSADRVIASFTVDVPLAPNATITNTALPAGLMLTLSDGVQTLTQQSGVTSFVQLTTDASGNISTWSMGLNSAGNGISTQKDPVDGTVDLGFMGSGTLCESPTDCGSVASNAGTWTSTNAQSLHVIVGTTSGTNPATGQLYQIIVGGTASNPTLTASTILSETPEPASCFGGQSGLSGLAAAITGLAFVPNATSGYSDLLAANGSVGDVFRLSGPSYQPTADINNASPNCWHTGPAGVSVAADAAGDVVGAGYDINHSQKPALYYFPPSPTNTAPNFVLMDNVNTDPSLTGSCSTAPPAGCVGTLVDTVVAQRAVSAAGVAAGDMLVLVGDAYSGNGNAIVLRFPAASIQSAKAYASNCSGSFGNTSGAPPPCVANSGGSQLVTQTTLASFLSSGEAPVSMDISPIDGSLFIATSAGNIYQLSPTASGYANPTLYAFNQTGIAQLRVGQSNNTLYVFATVPGADSPVIVTYVGAAPVGGFQPFAPTGVIYTSVNGAPAGLAVH